MDNSMFKPAAALEGKLKQETVRQKDATPMELMTLRAERAEKALLDCNEYFEALKISYDKLAYLYATKNMDQ